MIFFAGKGILQNQHPGLSPNQVMHVSFWKQYKFQKILDHSGICTKKEALYLAIKLH
jgi:hypothetical protein